jgi:hypothetical protein
VTVVAGVDTSSPAYTVVVRDAATGQLVRAGRAPHPDGTAVAPQAWADAVVVVHASRQTPTGRRPSASPTTG